jgi:Protein of unknown function (DUF664)
MAWSDVEVAALAGDTSVEPPLESGTGRADVLQFLSAQRSSVLAIVAGLDDAAMRRAIVPSGWTPIGMVEHLAHAERLWFQHVVAGRTTPRPWPPADDDDGDDGDDEAGFDSAHPPSEVIAFYRDQCARSDAVLAGTSLMARPSGQVPPDMQDEIHDVHSIVLHMIEETARHAGHLDIARELIDGRTGLGPR